MSWESYKITAVRVVRPYVLELRFADGLSRAVDLEPMLMGEMYGALRSPETFSQVALDEQTGTVHWPNGADFDPAILHDWERFAPELERRAKEWAHSPRGAQVR